MGMEYIYAAMLLHKAGKPINERNLTQVLTVAGVNADPVRVKALVAALEEIDIEGAIQSATLVATPAIAPTPTTSTPTVSAKKEEEEKKRKEEEEREREEVALEGLSALFG